MHCLVVLCLLSAAVALPTSEQLHTNLLPPPPGLKSEEKDNIIDEQVLGDPIPPLLDAPESEGAKNPSESAETPKAEKDEDKDKLPDVITVIQKESKESEGSKDSKESKESKEFEEIPEQPKEEKKDSKYEESKEGDDDGPIIVQVLQKPSQKDWLPIQYNSNFQLPWPFSYITGYLSSKFRNGGQRNPPMYIVKESDFLRNY